MSVVPWTPRVRMVAIAIVLVLTSLATALLVHLFLGLLTLRIAAAPGEKGAVSARALAQIFAAYHPRLRVRVVPEPNLAAASAAIGHGRSDLAIVRSDIAGQDAETLVILRRDAALFLAVSGRAISGVRDLAGKRVGRFAGNAINDDLLVRLADRYGLAKTAIHWVDLTPDQIDTQVRHHRLDAVFVLAPLSSPLWRVSIAALKKAGGGAPTVVGIDEAAALSAAFPGLETLDISKGAIDGSLPAPDDDISTLSVSYRLVAPASMSNWLAGEVTREVLMSKPRLAALGGSLGGIEAPDTDDNAPALPIHAGASAYLSGDLQSLSDQVQGALYWFGLLASACVSIGAASLAIFRRVRPRRLPNRLMRLLEIWLIARSSDPSEKAALEHEIDELIHEAIVAEARGGAEATELRLAELVAAHARASLRRAPRLTTDWIPPVALSSEPAPCSPGRAADNGHGVA